MKRFTSGLLVVTSCLAAPAYAVDFWHSSTVWAGQGQCSATFSFDSGMEEIKNLQVTVSAVNKAGKKVASGVLEIPQFGQSSADRYADAFLEGEEICAELNIYSRTSSIAAWSVVRVLQNAVSPIVF